MLPLPGDAPAFATSWFGRLGGVEMRVWKREVWLARVSPVLFTTRFSSLSLAFPIQGMGAGVTMRASREMLISCLRGLPWLGYGWACTWQLALKAEDSWTYNCRHQFLSSIVEVEIWLIRSISIIPQFITGGDPASHD